MKTGADFTILPCVDSTNIYAMQEVHAHMATHGKVYFALEQTAGKGQRGRQWLSRPGENIMMSKVFRMEGLQTDLQFPFNMAIALACHDFFARYAGDEVSVKWPNDLYWRDRKAGGVLIENIIQAGRWAWAVAGMGININQTIFDPQISRKPVSLKQITGKEMDIIAAAAALNEILDQYFSLLLDSPGSIISLYQQVLFQKDQWVKLKKGQRVFEARIQGVDAYGRLTVFTTLEEYFNHGEIEWL